MRELDPSMGDGDLVSAIRAGDRDAVALLYDRYAARLHDFCFSMTRNRDDAADAVQDTFVSAMQHVGALRDPERLRPWLYAIARHECFRISKRRKRNVVTDEMPEYASAAPGPDDAASDEELRELVWAAAAGLADRDRALLDLNVRQGLEGAELAAAVGVEPSHVYVMLNRMRGQVERSLGALLVARTGRSDCPELAAIAGAGAVALTPLLRKRIARHVESCSVCEERRKRMVSPLALLGGATPALAMPMELRSHTIDAMTAAASRPRTVSVGRDGFPREPRRIPVMPTAVAACVAAAAAIALLLAGPDSINIRSSHASIAADATQTPLPGASATDGTGGTGAGDATPLPGSTDTPTLTPTGDTPTVSPTGTPIIDTSPPTVPPTPTPPTDSPTEAPPPPPAVTFASVSSDSDHVWVLGSNCVDTTTAHASFAGGIPSDVMINWDMRDDNGQTTSGNDAMTTHFDSTDYRATLGPFPSTGLVSWWVTATSSDGQQIASQTHDLTVMGDCIS